MAAAFSIVLPVYNEEENLPLLLDNLAALQKESAQPFEVVAVDDASTDRSLAILRQRAAGMPFLRVAQTPRNLGMGGALLEGCRVASGKYLIWCMADLADRLDDIAAILEKLDAGYDLVVASRAIPGGKYGELGKGKAFLSWTFSQVARALFGISVHDISNAFRGMTRDLLFSLNLQKRDFAISPEMVIRAHRMGAKIAEIPTRYHFRSKGKSNFSVLKMGWKYFLLLALRFAPTDKSSR